MTIMRVSTADSLTVHLTNRQRTFKIQKTFLISTAAMILRYTGQRTGELSVVLINDRAMRALNAKYRGVPKTTDVLSFPQSPQQRGVEQHLIGDVVISLQAATRQANARASTLHGEVVRLLVHGILHLLGYDHECGAREARRMKAKEHMIIRRLTTAGIVVSGF